MTPREIHARDPHQVRQERERERVAMEGDREHARELSARAARSARRAERIKQQQRAK